MDEWLSAIQGFDALIYWFLGVVLTSWGLYDLWDGRKTQDAKRTRDGAISTVLGLAILILMEFAK